MLFAAVLLAQSVTAPAPSDAPSANDVLFRALGRLRSYGTPPYVVYLAQEDGQTVRIAFRGSDEMMSQVNWPVHGDKLPAVRVYRAFVGPLSYSVHEAIATPTPMAAASPAPTATQQSPTDLEATLKTIAVVSSHGRLYDVRISGTEKVNDHQTYRIALHPLRDPERNAIRDLWIDTTTYDIVRADYVYTNPPDMPVVGSEADLTVNFETVGNYRIAARWIAIYHAPVLRGPVVRELRIVKMAFPAALPAWLFDAGVYAAHRHAGEDDVLAGVFDATSP